MQSYWLRLLFLHSLCVVMWKVILQTVLIKMIIVKSDLATFLWRLLNESHPSEPVFFREPLLFWQSTKGTKHQKYYGWGGSIMPTTPSPCPFSLIEKTNALSRCPSVLYLLHLIHSHCACRPDSGNMADSWEQALQFVLNEFEVSFIKEPYLHPTLTPRREPILIWSYMILYDLILIFLYDLIFLYVYLIFLRLITQHIMTKKLKWKPIRRRTTRSIFQCILVKLNVDSRISRYCRRQRGKWWNRWRQKKGQKMENLRADRHLQDLRWVSFLLCWSCHKLCHELRIQN